MDQSKSIIAFVLLSFLVYVTRKGQLGAYLSILTTAGPAAPSSTNASGAAVPAGSLMDAMNGLLGIKPGAASGSAAATTIGNADGYEY
jgi:hypothetical protein